MKQMIKNKKQIIKVALFTFLIAIVGCEDNNLPEIGSIADLTPPEALFASSQGIGPDDEWKTYSFANLSSGATDYSWDFGNGSRSTSFEPFTTFPGEGTFTVSLTASDKLGVESIYTEVIEVVEPIAVVIPDPVLINADFDRVAKLGSSNTCACSGWDNDDIGEQGESSSGNGSDVVKFDNNEPDHIYQEFAVTPNADYTITVIVQNKPIANPPGTYGGSMLEFKILAGSGYINGYTPTYYATAPEFPNDGYGYNSSAQVEDPANNLINSSPNNPIVNAGDESYNTYIYTFNAGNNDSVALFVRGIGGDPTVGNYGYTSGDEEIRMDSVTITAN
jgi:hypothetical protein